MTQRQFQRATIVNSTFWIIVLVTLEIVRRLANG